VNNPLLAIREAERQMLFVCCHHHHYTHFHAFVDNQKLLSARALCLTFLFFVPATTSLISLFSLARLFYFSQVLSAKIRAEVGKNAAPLYQMISLCATSGFFSPLLKMMQVCVRKNRERSKFGP
jgi:hypothetical protein